MTDQRTMAKLLRAPTEGYAEVIVVPRILAEQFELKHSLINMMASDQFFGLEKDNPHDHIRWGSLSVARKRTLAFYSHLGESCDANSSSSEIAKLTYAVNQQTSVVTTIMTATLKQFQATPPPASVKAVEEICVTCGGAHPELKCKALADLGASINLMPLSVWKKLGLPELISTRITLELTNRAICTPARIARDVFVSVGKFTFPADFVIVDYESDPRVPLILGRPFLRTARALIDVHGEEMILRDGDERLTLNIRHDTSSYSNQPQNELINMINIYDDSSNVLIEKLLDLDSTKDLHPPHNVNPLSGSTTSSSPNHLLEEFSDELALITFPPGNDDLPFDIYSDLKEREYLLNHDPIKDMDSILKDSVDEDNLGDTMPEMFTNEHALDYSSPQLQDEYDDDLFEVESNTEYIYNDPFNSKGKKIKESKLLIDELDLPSDFLPSSKYDSFLFEDFSKVDALPSTNNEDKLFNPGILNHENLFEVITRVASDKNVKKLAISHASLILEDFDPLLYELPFFNEVPGAETLLSFSFKNKEKVFKPRILTSKGVHSSFILKLSHQGYKIFKIIKILKSPMKIFLFSHGEDICILDVPFPHFYPYE
nr:reverse transcriptase domain-containing protein [Tanacetum cinerariifolium]